MLKFFNNKDHKQKKSEIKTVKVAEESQIVDEVKPMMKEVQTQVFEDYSAVTHFGFPLKSVYPVQEILMNKIYHFLQNNQQKLGLFSSPTGTGKSLSIICACLSFYMDPNIKVDKNKSEDDWEALFGNQDGSNMATKKDDKPMFNHLTQTDLKQIKQNLAAKRKVRHTQKV